VETFKLTHKNGADWLEEVYRRCFHPHAWAAIDLKAGPAREGAFTLRRAPPLPGRGVGPDRKPLGNGGRVWRPRPPFEGVVYHARQATRPLLEAAGEVMLGGLGGLRPSLPGELSVGPVELRDGRFEIPVLDSKATYRLHFLDAAKELGG